MRKNNRFLSIAALGAAAALALTACGSDDNGDASNGGTTDNGSSNGSTDNGGSEDKNISIAIHSGWDEGIAVSYLWKAALEEAGYEVELGDPAEAEIGRASCRERGGIRAI